MKLSEIMTEKKVESTWIADLSHNRPSSMLKMKLSNGKVYSVAGITRRVFELWSRAPSTGKYFHQNIAGRHHVRRIK